MTNNYWSNFYRDKPQYSLYDEQNIPRLVEVVKLIKNTKKHLDVGCGTGLFTKMVIDKFPDSEGHGIDYVDSAIEVASQDGVGIFKQADATSLPFEDNAFDLAHSSGTIAHLEDPRLAIKEVLRVLSPGGLFLMTLSSPDKAVEKKYEDDQISKFTMDMLDGFDVKLKYFGVDRLSYDVIARKK